MANETGGRVTRSTNDLTLGYLRAQRDLNCNYVIGFYLEDRETVRPRRTLLEVKRPGLRILHPRNYQFRSKTAKEHSRITAAFFAPELYQSGFVRANAFLLQPRTPDAWDVLLGISFPVIFDENLPDSYEIEFGAVLNQDFRVAHQFNRKISMRPLDGANTAGRRFTFLEPVVLSPGLYTLTVVASRNDNSSTPDATRIQIEIPYVTKRELMLVTPILGKKRDRNIVVRGDGPDQDRRRYSSEKLAEHDIVTSKGSFEPMMVQRAGVQDELLTRNKACVIGTRRDVKGPTVTRTLAGEEGDTRSLQDVPLVLESRGKKDVTCQNLFEILPEGFVEPGRYEFEATISNSKKFDSPREILRFAVREQQPEQ